MSLTDGIAWSTHDDGEGVYIYAEFDGRAIRTRINKFPMGCSIDYLTRFTIEQMQNHISIVRARERFANLH